MEGSSMNVTGIVEQLGTKPVNTKFGSKTTYSAKVNGQWFRFGFKDPKFTVGDSVSLEYTPGQYGNEVTNFGKSTATTPAAAAVATPEATPAPAPRPSYGGSGKGVFPIPALDGQRSIVRQNALTNARELFAASQPKGFDIGEAQLEVIINIAKTFEAYTAGDRDLELAKASIEGDAATKH
jgi:hypothetical protein